MGPPSDCPATLTCPSTPTSFHFWAAATPPILTETPSWALEKERIWASWLPHSLQLPGFLIDGDYYIIDLLDRTVPALGTLCPSSKPAPGPGTSSTEPAALLCRLPQHQLHSRAGDPGATLPGVPGATFWDGAGARLGVRPAPRRSRGWPAEYGFTSASPELWDPAGPFQPELGTWEPVEVGIGGAGARVGQRKEFGKDAGAGKGRLGEGADRGSGGGTLILTGLPPSPTGGFGKTEQAAKAWLEILQPTLLGTQSWRAGAGRGERARPRGGQGLFWGWGPWGQVPGEGVPGAVSPQSASPFSFSTPSFSPSSPSPAPVLQIAGRLNSLRASPVDS